MSFEFQAPASAVDVWATESVLVQVTVVPWVTVNEFGEKAKFEIVTALGVEV